MQIFQSNDLVSVQLEVVYKDRPYLVKATAEEYIPGFCVHPISITFGVSVPDGSVEVVCGCFVEGSMTMM